MKTKIQWCDYTWNPWRGCTKVSPGCANCYAEKLVTTRLGGNWGKGKPRQRASDRILHAPYIWNQKPFICHNCGWPNSAGTIAKGKCCERCSCKRLHRARIFLGSLMDIFDPEVPIDWFARSMMAVRACSEIDFLLVTKRPELGLRRIKDARNYLTSGGCADTALWLHNWLSCLGFPPHNVWLITSTENQEQLEKRCMDLLQIPAVIHGLSCEPLLGPLQLQPLFEKGFLPNGNFPKWWVIAGGESGPNARPCQVEWLRDIQLQCEFHGVPYFCKQFGSDPRQDLSTIPEADISDPNLDAADIAAWESHRHSVPLDLADKKGGTMSEWPDAEMRVRQWPAV